MATKKRYTVGRPGGAWVVWEQTPILRWVAKCPNEETADQIARILNKASV